MTAGPSGRVSKITHVEPRSFQAPWMLPRFPSVADKQVPCIPLRFLFRPHHYLMTMILQYGITVLDLWTPLMILDRENSLSLSFLRPTVFGIKPLNHRHGIAVWLSFCGGERRRVNGRVPCLPIAMQRGSFLVSTSR